MPVTSLEWSPADLTAFFELSPDLFCIAGTDGYFKRLGPAWTQVLGWSPEELTARPIIDFVHPDDRAATLERRGRQLQGQPVVHFQNRYATKDGGWRWFSWASFCPDGRTIYGVARNVTPERESEAARFEAEARFRNAFEHSSIGKALIGVDGRWMDVNASLCEMVGYTAEEMQARTFEALTHPDDHAAERVQAERLFRGEIARYRIEKRYLHRDGHVVWTLHNGSAVRGPDGAFLYFLAGIQDISALKEIHQTLEQRNAELERARDAAEAADRAKSAFLATMSHEIRTPLNSIIGFGELLADSPLNADQAAFVDRVTQSSQVLLKLINDVLDLSKIDAGIELEDRPFNLRGLIESVVGTLQPQAASKGLHLYATVDATVPPNVVGDEHRIRQVLANYLGNALKFTAQGQVHLAAHATSEGGGRLRLHVAVQDTGIGIPADRMDRLFKSFSQVDTSTTRRYGGTGLGLAISKRLAELMDGEVWAESDAGIGSTFHFTARLQEQQAAVAPRPALTYAPVNTGLRILLAEDVATNRDFMAAVLRRLGLSGQFAVNGVEAVEAIRAADHAEAPFDVVFMDVQMPEMDGMEATRRIRALLAPERQPRIIALTADAFIGDRERCLEAGMDDYLSKPLLPRQIAEVLSRCHPLAPPSAV